VHEHVPHRPTADRVAVDEFGDGELPAGGGLLPRRRPVGQAADLAEQVVDECQGGGVPAGRCPCGGVGGQVGVVDVGEVFAGDDGQPGQGGYRVPRVRGRVGGADAARGGLVEVGEGGGLVVAAVGVVEVLRAVAEQPRVGRADGAEHDQHTDPGEVLPPAFAGELLGHPPRRAGVAAAEQPPGLPGVGGEAVQPGQCPAGGQLLGVALPVGGVLQQHEPQLQQILGFRAVEVVRGRHGRGACSGIRSSFGSRRLTGVPATVP
jgi:hypothetical protein